MLDTWPTICGSTEADPRPEALRFVAGIRAKRVDMTDYPEVPTDGVMTAAAADGIVLRDA